MPPSITPKAETTQSSFLHIATLAAIGVVACIAADMVHEALGHGVASWLTKDPILSISTVALQNAEASRFVSAAGTLANCLVGALSLLILRRAGKRPSLACFLWLFGVFNLLNSGYLVVSGLLLSGDWAYVISGLSPFWLWRGVLIVAGAGLYFIFLRWSVTCLIERLARGTISREDIKPLVIGSYIAGGAVMTIASIFNPISPSLILMSGAGASFGLNAGLLFIPGIVADRIVKEPIKSNPQTASLHPSVLWLLLAIVVAILFIAVLGPGVRFASSVSTSSLI